MIRPDLTCFSAAALLAALLPSASSAQVVIDMTYGANSCSFTTNASGVSLDPATGHVLAANADSSAFSGACGGSAPVIPAVTQQLQSNVASPTVNQAFTLSWNTSNVDYCKTDGTTMPAGASIATWPLSGTICSGAACAPGAVSVTATTSGSYNFNLQCFKTGNTTPATTSLAVNVQSSGTGVSCTNSPPVYANRQATVSVKYTATGGVSTVDGLAANGHDRIFGYTTTNGSIRPFQQTSNVTYSMGVQSNAYLALAFSTPSNMSRTAAGDWKPYDTRWLGLPWPGHLSYSVSQCPGDFSANVPSGCKATWTGTEGDPLVYIGPDVSDPTGAYCKLDPGKTYYLNIVTATLASPNVPDCSSSTCEAFFGYHFYQ